ncbi:MAG: hypothetical protein M5T61_04915 [Acidimicrobiia bacterium]|nr:hypothetical protein [Acidimicrobiia bacterium]
MSKAPGPEPTLPNVTLNPKRPLYAQGIRIEPPPSLPVQMGMIPAATAAAEPPEEPPGVRSTFQGLRVTPWMCERVQFVAPNSGEVVLPTTTAPAARRRDLGAVLAGDLVCEEKRAMRVGHALRRGELLDPHRHAGPGPGVVAVLHPTVDLLRLLARAVGVDVVEGVELAVEPLEPLQVHVEHFTRREASGADVVGDLPCVALPQLAHRQLSRRVGRLRGADGLVCSRLGCRGGGYEPASRACLSISAKESSSAAAKTSRSAQASRSPKRPK